MLGSIKQKESSRANEMAWSQTREEGRSRGNGTGLDTWREQMTTEAWEWMTRGGLSSLASMRLILSVLIFNSLWTRSRTSHLISTCLLMFTQKQWAYFFSPYSFKRGRLWGPKQPPRYSQVESSNIRIKCRCLAPPFSTLQPCTVTGKLENADDFLHWLDSSLLVVAAWSTELKQIQSSSPGPAGKETMIDQ